MDPFFEQLRQAVILKKFFDELEKNPGRTLLALGAVLLLTGAGAAAVLRKSSPPADALHKLPVVPASRESDGTFTHLPQAVQAEQNLSATIAKERARATAVERELQDRKDDAPPTEREIQLINEAGHVKY